ncbi:MAG: DUF5706 domain-containing protein [Saprospiraceae bacterium]|nr:DUF5706 domain-containing protein [Saprospiraceae bacterium]
MVSKQAPQSTSENAIIATSEHYVALLLKEKLTKDHVYHNLSHTLSVRDACLELGRAHNLSSEDLEVLELACLFHDTGFTSAYKGHEEESMRIARDFLTEQAYPEPKLRRVLECIEATYLASEPANQLEEIIRDADLINLGKLDYLESLGALRHEWAVFLNQSFSDPEWYRLNYKFLKEHTYFTEVAEATFGEQRDKNLKLLKKLLKKAKKNKVKKGSTSSIQTNKGAQMMFKTSLRNHLDLSTLADNKANIMLSVNALIITIVMPVAVTYIRENFFLLFPLGTLLLTCLASMIFATLATRPIKMHGHTSEDTIARGESNLFFFGNFYRMSFPDYQKGMQKIVNNEENLENAIMRDLFYLGKSLGLKYRQLRTCYTIFMVGVILTVMVFTVFYYIYAT